MVASTFESVLNTLGTHDFYFIYIISKCIVDKRLSFFTLNLHCTNDLWQYRIKKIYNLEAIQLDRHLKFQVS